MENHSGCRARYIENVTLAGMRGLKEGVKGKNVNWKGDLTAGKKTLKRKAVEELNKAVKKKVRKDLFGF